MKLSSFKHAFSGIFSALKSEHNFIIMFFAFILVLIFNMALGVSAIHWIATLICCGMCLGAELINSAIEKCVDMISPEIREEARLAKDFAAGASLVLSIMSAVVAAIIYLPYLFNL